MKITVIGAGYVGLVQCVCLADFGFDVTCIEKDSDKLKELKFGRIPFYEPGLEDLFKKNLENNRLNFINKYSDNISRSDVIFICVGTPPKKNGQSNLNFIDQATKEISKKIKGYTVVVSKSTVPVGTSDRVKEAIAKNAKVEFDVVSNPEFLREGFAVDDFLKPERIVVGSSSEKATQLMEKLYKPFVRSGNPIIIMDEKSAELTKYAANAFLATKITFMNEIANFCEKVGADVDKVRIGMGTDSRIGKRFLFPGIGYGGSCFPKDVKALHKSGKDHNYNFEILDAVVNVNQEQKLKLIPKIKDYFNNNLKGKKIAVWGLAFKPETDDIREAPALYTIDNLLQLGAHITAFDPEAMPNVKRKYEDKIAFSKSMYEALEGADALIICTEWSIFRTPDFSKIKSLLNHPVIFDGRNLYDVNDVKNEGFTYLSIGR